MERRIEINFSLVLVLSVMMHLFLVIAVIAPQYTPSGARSLLKERAAGGAGTGMRDVIVNINADDKPVETRETLFSDRDSSARGHITRDYGDTWLNNSREFALGGSGAKGKSGSVRAAGSSKGTGSGAGSGSGSVQASRQALSGDAEDYPISLTLLHDPSLSGSGAASAMEVSEWTKIPDKKGVTMKNALFLSNDGKFAFNTKKFADFEYFRKMKNKIASNWLLPGMAVGIMNEGPGRNGMYTPGYTAFRMIGSQDVKLYFTMDRDGNVVDVVVLDSEGNDAIDASCVSAIRSSHNFGKVPESMKGAMIVIPFIFSIVIW